VASEPGLEDLIGVTGAVHTPLRPVGVVTLNGSRVDVVAESGMIEKGAEVRVIKVEGNRVVVRQIPKAPADEGSMV
jgi:membrane-bound serine protease (ClpP class)